MVRCSLYKSGAHPPWGPVDLIWSTILYPGGVHSTRAAASLGVSGRDDIRTVGRDVFYKLGISSSDYEH